MLLRVKVSIVGSEPAIWRLFEIDPPLTMDRVHKVLQTAVGWRDSHLHSFTDIDPNVRLRAVNGIVRETVYPAPDCPRKAHSNTRSGASASEKRYDH